MSHLILYIGTSCPYCMRVLDYIKKNRLQIEIKDVWSDNTAYQEMLTLTGRTQVPCLRIDDSFMHESLDIIEKLNQIHKSK
ncbi:MAG: glutaredoxin family protein [Candidatus Berkiella sp.]